MPNQERILKQQQTLRANKENEAFKALAGSDVGRSFLYYLLDLLHHFDSAFHTESQITAYNLGKQDSSRILLDRILNIDPGAYAEIIEQRRKEDQANALELTKQDTEDAPDE